MARNEIALRANGERSLKGTEHMSLQQSSTHTNEQVDALVAAAADLLEKAPVSNDSLPAMRALERALAPFQPDPDIEVLAAMARAMHDTGLDACAVGSTTPCHACNVKARAALAAYRNHTNGGAQ